MALTGLVATAAALLLTITSGLLPDTAPAPAADPNCAWRLASTQLYADLVGRTDNRSTQLRALLAATGVGSSGFLPSTCTGGPAGPAGSGSTGSGNPSGASTGATGGGSTGATGGGTGGAAPAGSYVFDDEFNGTSPDGATWSVLNRPGDASNHESQCYKPDNVTEAGGYLQITSKVDTCPTGERYSSGAVAWKSSTLTYGTIEIRAKQSGGQGSWPAQWLLGADCQHAFAGTAENTGGCNWPNPGSDEVDITEFKSDGPGVDWQNVVSGASGFKTCKPTLSDASRNWHTYTLTWAPGSLTWGIDGKTTCTQQQAVPTGPMFLIINNAMGGSGGPINNADFPQTMQIDYVRATANTTKPTAAAATPSSGTGGSGSGGDPAGAVSNGASTGTATGGQNGDQGSNRGGNGAGPTSGSSEGGN
ncbi:glycoside hydrolase family 16 protein [uncultured Pseudonocardia sp.]|jgi:beta-glucanase (GH16 family)|uniref:glycoside hydrolase family 16 protein n=1 Tax=uncultured Pseudonocardia sp. TaxID=211455 RepID=UPI0026180F3F|nr:glycoside hydrolase family 16 protein [uncultured Pseudonocardia sp.]